MMNDQIQINELAILPLEVAHSAAVMVLSRDTCNFRQDGLKKLAVSMF
jgi:hypothetical protein